VEIPEHHSGRILGRGPMQRRPQLGWRLGADGEAHQQIHPLMVVVREQVEQPRQHASLRDGPARPSMPGQVQGDDVPEIGQVFELAHPDILALLEAVGVRYIMPGGGQR